MKKSIISKVVPFGMKPDFNFKVSNTKELLGSFTSINDLNELDASGNTRLHRAVLDENYEVAEKLLQLNVDINKQSKYVKNTALISSINHSINITKLLLTRGANCNLTNGNGNLLPVSYAAELGKLDHLKLLLEHGVNPNQRLLNNETALIRSAFMGQMDSIKMLLDYGADYTVCNTRNQSAAYIALTRGHQDICNYINAFAKEKASEKEYASLLDVTIKDELNDDIELVESTNKRLRL